MNRPFRTKKAPSPKQRHVDDTSPLPTRNTERSAARSDGQVEGALIRLDFAYRFHMAKQELCAVRRMALVAALAREQEDALAAMWIKVRGEAQANTFELPDEFRAECKTKKEARRRILTLAFRLASAMISNRIVARTPDVFARSVTLRRDRRRIPRLTQKL